MMSAEGNLFHSLMAKKKKKKKRIIGGLDCCCMDVTVTMNESTPRSIPCSDYLEKIKFVCLRSGRNGKQ